MVAIASATCYKHTAKSAEKAMLNAQSLLGDQPSVTHGGCIVRCHSACLYVRSCGLVCIPWFAHGWSSEPGLISDRPEDCSTL